MAGKQTRRHGMTRGVTGVLLALLAFLFSGTAAPADQFPFDQELLLDAAPMRPGKRMPILVVETNGHANIDLWCKTVSARVDISGSIIKIEPDTLPEGKTAMQRARKWMR